MGISNDLKVNGGNLERDLRESAQELKDGAREAKNQMGEGVRETIANGMHDALDLRMQAEDKLKSAGRSLKERAGEGLDYAKDTFETAQKELEDAGRRIPWKTVASAVAGVVVFAGLVLLVRRRMRHRSLVERGFNEGARLAGQLPDQFHHVQKEARKAAKHWAKDSLRFWDKRPRIHIEMK
jgi:ElaB/YqjD/DUF883 family membrane-anchored ribosome-binding protein